MYNYSMLKGKIAEKYGTQKNFAKAMNILPQSLSLKLANKVSFSQQEIMKAIELLGIKKKDVSNYFFCKHC